jgi:hypothetical protein
VEECLPRRVAQEFEAQAGRSGLGRGSDGSTQVGNPVSEKKKEVLARVLQVQTLFTAQDHTRERKEEGNRRKKEGEWVARAYPHRRRPIHHGLPTRTTTGTFSSGGYSSPACSMLTMRTEGVVGLRELATPAKCRNLDVDKVRAANSLIGAVMVMVIIIVEKKIKSSRCEEG